MKKIFNILCVAAAIVALASCAKENLTKIKAGSEKVFQAGFDITKTNVDAAYKTTWAEGDLLKIINQYDGNEIIEIPEASFGSATTAITTTVEDADYYYAVYGDEGAYYDGYNLAIHIDEIQGGTWGDAQKAAAIAIDNAFNLKNISSIIEFNVSEEVCSVEFVSEVEGFSTEVYVTFSGEGEPVCETQSTAETISVETSFNAGTFYACVLPTELSELTINISDGDEIKSIHIDTPISLTAGKVLKLGNIESRAGKTFKVVSKETFSAVTGDIDSEGAFSYKANKGGGSSNPAINNGCIRIYQGTPGGNIEITSNNGDKIKGIKVTNGKNYNSFIAVEEDDAAFNAADTVFVGKNKTRSFSGLNANKVTIYNYSPEGSSSYRFELYSISVTYEVDLRTPQTLSFPQASYSVKTGETFEAPTVSGAMTAVTYSTSNPEVATVNASTGAVSIIAAGTCVISATAEGTETYKEGVASYELTVAAGATGIAGIKTIIRSVAAGTETSFVADVEDMLITYCQKSAYPYIAYAQDKNGDAIYFWGSSADDLPFVTGDKFTGSISGKGKVKNGLTQITEINIGGANKTSGCTVTPQVVTLENLMASYSSYEYKIIKVEAATIVSVFNASTTGEITQNSTSANIRGGSSTTISVTEGSVADIIAFPAYYNTDTQLVVWKQDQITVKGGVNIISGFPATKNISVDEEWTIGATCLSGEVSYEIVEGSDKVSLSNGKITGLAEGTATIKATSPATGSYTSAEATCTITVSAAGSKTYTALFGTDYNSAEVSSYAETWYSTTEGFRLNVTNFNNNKNGWTYIKGGKKKTEGIATLSTNSAISEAISTVKLTIDAISTSYVNSIKLYVSTDSTFPTGTKTQCISIDKSTGTKVATVKTPTKSCYYKIEFDFNNTTNTNGIFTVSKVEFCE